MKYMFTQLRVLHERLIASGSRWSASAWFLSYQKAKSQKPSINDHLSLNMKRGGVFTPPFTIAASKADNPSLCNTLAETAEDHRRLSPGCISAGRQCSGTGAINQPLGIGPLKRLHCIGADRAKISISAQVGSGRCVIALLLSKPIQDGPPAADG